MYKILILTTERCYACTIAKNNIVSALVSTNKEIEVEDKDWHEVSKEFILSNKIKDFPAVLYMIDDKVVYKAIGSYPSAVYLRWINIYFKN